MGFLTDAGNAVILFVATLTDYRLWRSLGWLLLGIVMIAAGLGLLARDAAAGTVSKIVGGR